MPRTARASVGGNCYHLLNRGNARRQVFHKPEDCGKRKSYVFTYYDAGLLATVDNDGTPNVPNVVLTYSYHYGFQRGRVADDLGVRVDIGYDMSRRPTQFDWTVGFDTTSIGFEFDEASRIVEINREADVTGGIIQTLLEYDLADRVTSIEHLIPGGSTFSAFAYMYNLEAELTDYSGPDGDLEFAYDETHQLIDVMGDRSESYSYDTNGNRTESHLHGDDYVTGDNNQLLSDGVYDYGYDNEGNRNSKEHIGTGVLTVYGWDHRNRLTSVTTTDAMSNVLMDATFVYDVFDRLIGRIVDADGDGMGAAEELWTVYDGIHAWADFDDAGDLLNHYLYGPAVDMIMARICAADDISYHLTDHLGSVRQNVAYDGTILNEIDYDAFGNILNETSPTSGDRFKFTAREWEAAVELVHSRHRWLDTESGRFISEDPIGFLAGEMNLSLYVGNEVLSLTDPLGLDPECETFAETLLRRVRLLGDGETMYLTWFEMYELIIYRVPHVDRFERGTAWQELWRDVPTTARRFLGSGCMGITGLMTGHRLREQLTLRNNCYATQTQALNAIARGAYRCEGNARPKLIFYRWNNLAPIPAGGKPMSICPGCGYITWNDTIPHHHPGTGTKPDTFDYAYYDFETETWWGADYGEQVAGSRPWIFRGDLGAWYAGKPGAVAFCIICEGDDFGKK
jgi:RHS repeat-associated protein